MTQPTSMQIENLHAAYLSGEMTPRDLIEALIERTRLDPHRVWIHRLSDTVLRAYAVALADKDPQTLPLYGIPFAIKDNIDLAGAPTTAACPAFSYQPQRHAFVVQRLIDAGAIPIGKTNMDQFAAGLNGSRSPYGACLNSVDPRSIAGGSSSGSAVAVALGYASFALGTDTAGSGRVPAAFNNIVGHKPTRGWISTTGVVPACRSLDTISIFALNAEDAERVLSLSAAFDAEDPFSRDIEGHGFDFGRAPQFRMGVPRKTDLQFFGNPETETLYAAAIKRAEVMGAQCIEVDFSPFLEVASLLYDGPWVAERYAAICDFFESHTEALLPTTREIIGSGKRWSAADAYLSGYRLAALKKQCDAIWQSVDVMLTPTAGTIYTVAEMQANPIELNSKLGYYTNFMNLLDYAASAVPAGFQRNGLPFGVTFFAPANQDGPLLHWAARWQRDLNASDDSAVHIRAQAKNINPLPSGQIRVAVCGAHLSGLPLNWQLSSRDGRLIFTTTSSPDYKLYALPGGPPYRPGMVRVDQGGASIEVEVWELPLSKFGSFVAGIPAPLGIGMLSLADGTLVQGFVCEAAATIDAEDITHFGGWRAFLTSESK